MTKLLEQSFEAARNLPPNERPVPQLTAEEEASFDESLAQAERGEFTTDDQIRSIWAKQGL
ncbi:MAG: hypothetical protein WBO09_10370 [Methylocystis silviterrae]|uniref:hypothetical protein n=1 Tax=Methylocystis silviterrae TaxID=2743612 RepID=UPI003C71FB99